MEDDSLEMRMLRRKEERRQRRMKTQINNSGQQPPPPPVPEPYSSSSMSNRYMERRAKKKAEIDREEGLRLIMQAFPSSITATTTVAENNANPYSNTNASSASLSTVDTNAVTSSTAFERARRNSLSSRRTWEECSRREECSVARGGEAKMNFMGRSGNLSSVMSSAKSLSKSDDKNGWIQKTRQKNDETASVSSSYPNMNATAVDCVNASLVALRTGKKTTNHDDDDDHDDDDEEEGFDIVALSAKLQSQQDQQCTKQHPSQLHPLPSQQKKLKLNRNAVDGGGKGGCSGSEAVGDEKEGGRNDDEENSSSRPFSNRPSLESVGNGWKNSYHDDDDDDGDEEELDIVALSARLHSQRPKLPLDLDTENKTPLRTTTTTATTTARGAAHGDSDDDEETCGQRAFQESESKTVHGEDDEEEDIVAMSEMLQNRNKKTEQEHDAKKEKRRRRQVARSDGEDGNCEKEEDDGWKNRRKRKTLNGSRGQEEGTVFEGNHHDSRESDIEMNEGKGARKLERGNIDEKMALFRQLFDNKERFLQEEQKASSRRRKKLKQNLLENGEGGSDTAGLLSRKTYPEEGIDSVDGEEKYSAQGPRLGAGRRRNGAFDSDDDDEDNDELWDEVVGDAVNGGGDQCRDNIEIEGAIGTRRRKGGGRGGTSQKRVRRDINNVPGNDDYLLTTMDEDELERLIPEFDNPKLGPPSALEPLVLPRAEGNVHVDVVPSSINRYLQPYQREGVSFLHSAVCRAKGVILGDDMGMGKTVQMISLLSALLKKTGTGKDKLTIARRRRLIEQEYAARQEDVERAMLQGVRNLQGVTNAPPPSSSAAELSPEWAPILLIAPPSVIRNWMNELEAWGHFAVDTLQERGGRANAMNRIATGQTEILICGRSLLSQESTFNLIVGTANVRWKLVIVDEYHEFKNRKRKAWKCLERLRETSHCPIVGMTGTAMQNDHEELWNLVHLAQPGLLGEWKEFEQNFVRTLKLARTKDAKSDVLELGAKRQEELVAALKHVYLSRKKKDYLQDSLTEKDEKVIFCELTDVQKLIYEHIMAMPDYFLLRMCNAPCDCGVNQVYFSNYKKLRTKREQVEYQRNHKFVPRKKHCYTVPWNRKREEGGEPDIDPDAVIWRSQHINDKECDLCPTCILLPALTKLYKVCSHPSLLQVERRQLDNFSEGSATKMKLERNLAFAKVALPPHILKQLPGKSYFREDGIMDDHMALSGKMKTLDYCLRVYRRKMDRVLIFSYSTTTLDLIQHYVRAKGYSHLRLDGSTPSKKRQSLIDSFQSDETIFLFLISTKAGGLGINLTAANKVIVYDVNWNPSYDEQAQDRAFRIGQKRNVEVIRLVAQGTVEELMYARQIYKVHLTKQTLGGSGGGGENDTVGGAATSAAPQPARIFRGVAKDKHRKGELFGLENLLKYKDGSFVKDMWKATTGGGGDSFDKPSSMMRLDAAHDTSALQGFLSRMSAEEIEGLGSDRRRDWNGVPLWADSSESKRKNTMHDENCDGNIHAVEAIHHDDFMREDRGGAALAPGDEGFEEEMGGASQVVHVTCALACQNIETPPDSTHHVVPEREFSKERTLDIVQEELDTPHIEDDIESCSSDENPGPSSLPQGSKNVLSSGGKPKSHENPSDVKIPYLRESQMELDNIDNDATCIDDDIGSFLDQMNVAGNAGDAADVDIASPKHRKENRETSARPSATDENDNKTPRRSNRTKSAYASAPVTVSNFTLMGGKTKISGMVSIESLYIPDYGKKMKRKRKNQ